MQSNTRRHKKAGKKEQSTPCPKQTWLLLQLKLFSRDNSKESTKTHLPPKLSFDDLNPNV